MLFSLYLLESDRDVCTGQSSAVGSRTWRRIEVDEIEVGDTLLLRGSRTTRRLSSLLLVRLLRGSKKVSCSPISTERREPTSQADLPPPPSSSPDELDLRHFQPAAKISRLCLFLFSFVSRHTHDLNAFQSRFISTLASASDSSRTEREGRVAFPTASFSSPLSSSKPSSLYHLIPFSLPSSPLSCCLHSNRSN